MSQTNRNNKIKLALIGSASTPKMFNALQIAYGLSGKWEKIIVIGSSYNDARYQHMGSYGTLTIPKDASPQRYIELLNLVGMCGKSVVILSSLSDEWRSGVAPYLSTGICEDLLRSHRLLFQTIRKHPLHVIACIDTERSFSYRDEEKKLKLNLSARPVQQEGIERNFHTVLHVDKKGCATVSKDQTEMLPAGHLVKVTPQVGALLHDWCALGKPEVPEDIQVRIDSCKTRGELYQLLFNLDIDDMELMSSFTKRRLELEADSEAIEQASMGGSL